MVLEIPSVKVETTDGEVEGDLKREGVPSREAEVDRVGVVEEDVV